MRSLRLVVCGSLLAATACKQEVHLISLTTNCVIDGGVYNAGDLEPITLNRCCRPEVSRTDWTDWFRKPVGYPFTSGPNSIVASDLLHRGALDLAVVSYESLDVIRNIVDGGFALSSSNAAQGIRLFAGDLNGDGYPDLLASNPLGGGAGQGGVIVLIAAPSLERLFSPPAMYLTRQAASAGALADFNQDGALDLAVALPGNGLPDRIQILWNQLSGNSRGSGIFIPESFSIPVGSSPPGYSTSGMAAGDLNGDGWPDLVVANLGDAGVESVSVLLNNRMLTEAGWFTPAPTLPAGPTGWDVALADLYGTGNLDIVLTQNGAAAVYVGHGDGTFATPVFLPAASDAFALAVADFDSDGVNDLAVAGFLGEIHVLRPSTSAEPIVLHSVKTSNSIVAGDFNLDGRIDLAVTDNQDNSIQVFTANCGDGR
jgi:hypothetical protein